MTDLYGGGPVRLVFPCLKAGIIDGRGVYAVNHLEGANVYVEHADGTLYRLLNVEPGTPWPAAERVDKTEWSRMSSADLWPSFVPKAGAE